MSCVLMYTGRSRPARFSRATESRPSLLASGTRSESAGLQRRLRRLGGGWSSVCGRIVVVSWRRRRCWRLAPLHGLNKCPFVASLHRFSSSAHVTAVICHAASSTGRRSPSTAASEADRLMRHNCIVSLPTHHKLHYIATLTKSNNTCGFCPPYLSNIDLLLGRNLYRSYKQSSKFLKLQLYTGDRCDMPSSRIITDTDYHKNASIFAGQNVFDDMCTEWAVYHLILV